MIEFSVMILLAVLAATALWAVYAARRLAYFLHMAQQNSYRPERYKRWLDGRKRADYRVIDYVAVIVVAMLGILQPTWSVYAAVIAAAVQNLTWKCPPVKKALVWTDRAKRLFAAAYGLVLVLLIWFAVWECVWQVAVGMATAVFVMSGLPLVMWFAVAARQPFENARNRRFVEDAARIIREMPDLTRIGITGSYGKTSSKMVLGRVLSEGLHTLVTPDSYNTPMGITLTVRNKLKPIHQVFVAEMGARQKGDIAELCDIVQPQIGILTAIGPQHLETFGSIETVADTKFELIDSLPDDGLAVLNIDDKIIAERAAKLSVPQVTYALDNAAADFRAQDIEFTPQGMRFTLITPKGEQTVRTALLGRHNIYNILAAAAVAEHLGLSMAEIARAIAQVPPVEHRLVAKNAGGYTLIDDAFNANPAGAHAAVEVLAAMPGGRKMIITPGMVELGSEQERLNREFAEFAASKLDFVVIVGQKQSAPLVAGVQAAGLTEDRYIVAADLNEALAFMRGWVRQGDYVLLENDLPDSYL